MVSLSRSFNTNSGGAVFFGESVNMDEREYLQPILESYGVVRPLNTICLFAFHLSAFAVLQVLSIIFTVQTPDSTGHCREYYVLIYVHVAIWFLTLIVDLVARMKHHTMRLHGYLEFYQKTQVHHRLPFYIVSLWNSAIMVIQAIIHQWYSEQFLEKCMRGGFLSPISYLCLLITFEFVLLAAISLTYIFEVRKFNQARALPDVQKEEWNIFADSFPQGEVGFTLPGEKFYDFVDKQADLIRHLKEHNARLGERIMLLNAQLQTRQ